MKRTVSIVLSIVMILALAVVPSFADETPANTGTITITLPTTEVAPTADSTYTVYKVFDATVGANGKISYKLVSGKTTAPTGFTVDTAGNVTYDGNGTELTDTDIANIKAYTGAAMGDPLGMPDYLPTLTFIAFTIAGFVQAYVHLVTLFPFYYAYGSIETLIKEKKAINILPTAH